MSLSNWIRIWGGIDICYILWVICNDLLHQKIPFYNAFIDLINISKNFEHFGILIFTVLIYFCSISIIFSGYFMLNLDKRGVYISLIQSPFRLFLIIPPTFFFIAKLGNYITIPNWIFLIVIILIEIIKIITQIKWLKLNL